MRDVESGMVVLRMEIELRTKGNFVKHRKGKCEMNDLARKEPVNNRNGQVPCERRLRRNEQKLERVAGVSGAPVTVN